MHPRRMSVNRGICNTVLQLVTCAVPLARPMLTLGMMTWTEIALSILFDGMTIPSYC